MTRSQRTALVPLTAAVALVVAGCSAPDQAASSSAAAPASSSSSASSSSASSSDAMSHMGHGGMDMEHPMDGGPAPEGIAEAASPKYPVGSTVTLTTDHMPGMEGATATVVGAFDTVTYSVTYTPTDGGPTVEDHKWVVQEELAAADGSALPDGRLGDGTEVTVEADHMPGMKGAKGVVESSTTETVYMVDYTVDGMTMKNHKWVVESEMTAAK